MSRAANRNSSKPFGGWATPLNNEKKRGRPPRSGFSRQILLQYVLSLLAYCFGLPLLGFFCTVLASSRTWTGRELLYPILSWARDYAILLLIGGLCAGILAITIYFICKPLRYVDSLVNTLLRKMARSPEKPVELPSDLSNAADRLNVIRQEMLRNSAAAHEAEQRKNDLIVTISRTISKLPLTSVIGYLDARCATSPRSHLSCAPDTPELRWTRRRDLRI